nr:hypothetical protein [Paraburkholderia sprentiae]
MRTALVHGGDSGAVNYPNDHEYTRITEFFDDQRIAGYDVIGLDTLDERAERAAFLYVLALVSGLAAVLHA